MKKLLSPRDYLSWSQISLFQRNPQLYIEKYIYGGAEDRNDFMDFGSKTAKALENGEEVEDELINLLVSILPKYSKPEFEIKVPFKTTQGTVNLLGKIDSFDPKTLSFREYKTGRTPWTAHRAQNHKQVDHYAAMIWLKYKRMPEKMHLDWAETEMESSYQVHFTGKVQTFEVKKSLGDILEYLSEVSKVAREIDEAYRKEIKNLT